jgi:hypothetical protein
VVEEIRNGWIRGACGEETEGNENSGKERIRCVFNIPERTARWPSDGEVRGALWKTQQCPSM